MGQRNGKEGDLIIAICTFVVSFDWNGNGTDGGNVWL